MKTTYATTTIKYNNKPVYLTIKDDGNLLIDSNRVVREGEIGAMFDTFAGVMDWYSKNKK